MQALFFSGRTWYTGETQPKEKKLVLKGGERSGRWSGGFTGHRRLPWGGDETDPRCAALKTVLGRRIAEAAAAGCGTFLCGMARGADNLFCRGGAGAAGRRLDLRLEALVPCPSQAGGWPAADRDRWTRLLAACGRGHGAGAGVHARLYAPPQPGAGGPVRRADYRL